MVAIFSEGYTMLRERERHVGETCWRIVLWFGLIVVVALTLLGPAALLLG